MAIVYFWEEAEKDYQKLDGNTKQWVDIAVARLEERGAEIGKSLGNTNYSRLSNFKELKQHKLGIRMIFKQLDDGTIEIIEIVAIGRRDAEKIFKIAEKRRQKRN